MKNKNSNFPIKSFNKLVNCRKKNVWFVHSFSAN